MKGENVRSSFIAMLNLYMKLLLLEIVMSQFVFSVISYNGDTE